MQSSWITTTPIAHRGLHNAHRPENSLPAFLCAQQHRYAIELDVQLSRDHRLVVFHDPRLTRMTGVDAPVNKLTYKELKSLRLGDTQERITFLDEVLETIQGRVPLLIEVKNEGLPGRLERLLCSCLEKYRGRFAVESFNPLSLQAIRRHSPGFHLGQLVTSFSDQAQLSPLKRRLLSRMQLQGIGKPDFLACELDFFPSPTVKRQRGQGKPILGFTIKSPEDLRRASAYCDNVIFEQILV